VSDFLVEVLTRGSLQLAATARERVLDTALSFRATCP